MLFGVGGVIGFIVDAGVLQLLVSGLAWDRFSGRLISFLCAATATWVFNRRYTFRGVRRHSLLGEWTRYIVAMSGGFACNFATYSALVLWFNIDGVAGTRRCGRFARRHGRGTWPPPLGVPASRNGCPRYTPKKNTKHQVCGRTRAGAAFFRAGRNSDVKYQLSQ